VQDSEHDEGPQEVELLFDAEGPQVEQEWGPPPRLEVIVVVEQEAPVGHETQRGWDVRS
jgi:hypothetical protein